MKKRWIVLLTMATLVLSVPIVTCAEKREEPETVQNQEETAQKKQEYLEQFVQGNISEDLFLEMTVFLEREQENLPLGDGQEKKTQFQEDYVGRLNQYIEEKTNKVAEILWRIKDYPDSVGACIDKHNKDMRYIQLQLAEYGIEMELEVSIEDFPILSVNN